VFIGNMNASKRKKSNNMQKLRIVPISELKEKYTEKLIREILFILSNLEDFVPAADLKGKTETTPLEKLLEYNREPFFYFESIRKRKDNIIALIGHGIDLAAMGERFVFKKTEEGLKLISRDALWLS